MYDVIIDGYLEDVTREMGAAQRAEVSRELRTHILDSADALASERKTNIDEAIIREVIARMGPADKLAAMYPTKKTFLEKSGMWKALQALGSLATVFIMITVSIWVVAPKALDTTLQITFGLVFAMALAMVVIIAIFCTIYLYESRIKVPYEARLMRLNKGLNDASSPLKVGFAIVGTFLGLILLTLFWSRVSFIAGFEDGEKLVPVLTRDFAGLLPYFILLGLLTIGVQLLYLVVRQKWVPSLLEVFLSCGATLLLMRVFSVFPFNPGFSPVIVAGIKVLLVFLVLGCLVAAAKKLWQTARLFIYGPMKNDKAA